MRNVLVFQFAQNQLKLRHFLLVRLADDDGGIDRRQHTAHVLDELDGTGAIDESVVVTHEGGGGERRLDTHLVVAGFFACVTYRGTRVDGALALDRACTGKDRFQKCGFAALEWAHQRNAPGTRASCAIGT